MSDAVSRAIVVLNDALARDPEAITQLVNLRIPCNAELAAHPLVQVAAYDGETRIGVLGLINGALGSSPSGVIGAKGTLEEATGRFLRVRRFVDLRNEKVDVIA